MSITLNAPSSLRRHTRMMGIVGAPLAALLVWLAADPLAGIDLAVRQTAGSAIQHVGPVSVVIAAVAAGLAAWGLRAILDRAGERGRTIWTAIALVALLLSLVGPLVADATMAVKVVLVSMHVAVAAAVVPAMAPSVGR